MLPLLSLAARADPPETLEPAALLGPWCLPGAPACAFDVREEGVWDEASDLVRPWTLQDRRVIFDPGGDLEQRWRIVETAADWIAAEQESTGVVLWFLRAPGPAPDFLADFAPARWPDRARIAGTARWRLLESEPWEPPGSPPFAEVVVLDARPDSLRVLVEEGGLRAAVWVELAGFSEHIVRERALSAGITALPGAPIERLGSVGGKPRVRVAEGGLSIEAVVAEEAIGLRYRPEPIDRTFTATLTAPQIRDADGAVIATLELDRWGWWVERSGEPEAGRVAVVVRTDHLRVTGFVPESALLSVEGGMLDGVRGGGMLGGTHSAALSLDPGTLLRRGGEIVGVTLRQTRLLAGLNQEPPDLTAAAWLPWGRASFELRCPSLSVEPEEWRCGPE